MTVQWKAIAVAMGVILLAPAGVLAADDADPRMQSLEDRLRSLEDRLQASESTVAAQRDLIRASRTPDVAQGGALDGMLSGLELGGHITASYIYNFGNPDTNGAQQPLNQFNANHNTFEFDAAKIEIGKPAGEPGTSGFQLDLLYGANNHILNGFRTTPAGLADEGVIVQEAYVSYNHQGTELIFGKFETLLGAEVIDSPYNNHIQHGILFTWAIPLVHTGLLAKGSLSEEIGWAAGVVNGFNNATDTGDNKGVLAQLSYDASPLMISLQAFIGSEASRVQATNGVIVGDDNHRTQIYDLVVTYEASDDTSLWLNVDYGFTEASANLVAPNPFAFDKVDSDPQWWGVAAGLKQQLNDKLTFALRGEYFQDDGGARLGCGAAGGIGAICNPFTIINDVTVISATATLGYQLTNNLQARLEFRRNMWDSDPDRDIFQNADPAAAGGAALADDDDQDIGILEISYVFD